MNEEHEHWAIRLRVRLLRPYPCRWNARVRGATGWMERLLPG